MTKSSIACQACPPKQSMIASTSSSRERSLVFTYTYNVRRNHSIKHKSKTWIRC